MIGGRNSKTPEQDPSVDPVTTGHNSPHARRFSPESVDGLSLTARCLSDRTETCLPGPPRHGCDHDYALRCGRDRPRLLPQHPPTPHAHACMTSSKQVLLHPVSGEGRPGRRTPIAKERTTHKHGRHSTGARVSIRSLGCSAIKNAQNIPVLSPADVNRNVNYGESLVRPPYLFP